MAALRDRLWSGLSARLERISRNGHPTACLPNTLNICFEGIEGDRLMSMVPGVAFSSGSACTTSSLEPSYVLRAMGLSDEAIYASLRFSLGRFTTAEEIDAAVDQLAPAVERLRAMSAAVADIPPDLFDVEVVRRQLRD